MIVDAGTHGSNKTDIVRDRSEMWYQFAEVHAAVAVFSESPGTAEKFTAGFPGVVVLDVARKRLQMSLVEFRFRVE